MKRRTRPLRARSERRQAFEDELAEARPLVFARCGGLCEVCGAARAEVVHHRLRRSQGGRNDLSNLVGACGGCHDWIHAHPALSYERGWLLRRPLDLSPYCA